MTTVVENNLKRLDLCENCAKESGAIHPSGFLAEEVLLGETPRASIAAAKCPDCGYPLESLQKTGRLGCATCYQRFSESLQGALVESQKGLIHQGKRPSRKKAGDEEWQAELNHFITVEDFEGAARLRDHIAAKKKSTPRRTRSS